MSDADSSVQGGEGSGGLNTHAVADSTLNQAFDLLANHRRRTVIATLQAHPTGEASVDELADHLLTHDPTAADRDRILICLHHKVLPQLDDSGVVDFDRQTNTVRYQSEQLVEDLLTFIAERNG